MFHESDRKAFSRRDLLRIAATCVPAIPLLGMASASLAQTKTPAAEAPAPAKAATPVCNPVPEKDPVATALKYVPDGSKVAVRAAKMGVEGKDQSCGNCQLYAKQSEEVGKCTMITTGCVNSKGWCTAWVKKA